MAGTLKIDVYLWCVFFSLIKHVVCEIETLTENNFPVTSLIRETTALATELHFYYDRDMEGVAVSSETVVSNHSQAVSI